MSTPSTPPTAEPVRIVIGIDFTAHANEAFDAAARLAASPSGTVELHLAYVINDPNVRVGANLAFDERLLREAYEQLRTFARTRGAALATGLQGHVFYHVRFGTVAQALVQVAVDVDASLVVVGTHGRRGLSKLVLGSVAQQLLSDGRIGVLVARPRSFDGLSRTPEIEPPKPGANIHAKRHDLVYSSEFIDISPRRMPHISGLF